MAEAQTIEKPAAAPDAATPSQSAVPPASQQQAPPASKPDAAKPEAKGSIYADLGEPEPGEKDSTSWPSTWREDMAKGIEDPKAADVLKRYQSPADLAKALIAAQQRIRSGEYKRAAPVDPDNPEAMKTWREEQGIPVEPKEYELPALAGVEFDKLPEDVRENIGAIRSTFHEANLTKEQGTKVAGAITALAEKQMEAKANLQAEMMDKCEDDLRQEWGRDYKTNLTMNIKFVEDTFGADMVDALLFAETPDGRRLADIPGFNKAINAMARAGGSDVLYDGESGGAKSISSRIAEIEKVMKTDFGKYQRELEPEYRGLLEEQEKRGKL